MMQTAINRAAEAIHNCDGLIIGAGAGMGVDSGLPDFRGNQGLWKAYPALGKARFDFTQAANPRLFASQPKLAWGFYGHRLKLYRETKPHNGFQILKKIASQLANGYQVFTSNVDGHFQAAGFNESRIYECHGSINYLQCSQPCCNEIWSASETTPIIDSENCLLTSKLPSCRFCGAISRPNILMFGDYAWIDTRSHLQAANMQTNLSRMKNPVVIECGAGTAIPTVRYFCEQQSAPLIRINPRESHTNNQQGISLNCGAYQGLCLILKTLTERGFFTIE